MNNLDKTYTNLLQDILDNGVKKETRNGGTISVFGRQIRHKMSEGFPLLTTKKMAWKSIVVELLWFLRGDTNIKYLVDNDCHIWDGDAYKNYVSKQTTEDVGSMNWFIEQIKTDDEFAKKWGELGPIYGKQWRSWTKYEQNTKVDGVYDEAIIDQIANSINLLKTDPDSRRNIVNAWNVGELNEMVLPPCHYGFQVYTRELSISELNILYNKRRGVGEVDTKYTIGTITAKDPNVPRRAISLMWNQRSVDTGLGLPFNIASYGLLLEIIARMVNMIPDELIGNLGDVHLYSNHIEQVKEQIGSELSLEEREHIYVYDYLGSDIGYNYDGDSELFDEAGIVKRTREPYPLPTLKHMKTDEFFKVLSEDLSMIGHLDNTDFQLENYQSHPTIKMPLSN